MPNWRFWEPSSTPPEPAPPERAAVPGRAPLPPPRQIAQAADPAAAAKLTALRRRRESMVYDLERAEAARRPDNPWSERIALLDESQATVTQDLAELAAEPHQPSWPLPPTPVTDIWSEATEPVTVTFRIGDEAFQFAEAIDWDQRGGPVVRGDLQQLAGDATRLVPADTPPERRAALAQHLVDSVYAFAVGLRDRVLEGEAPPASITLADLAEPCPICGGWQEWTGACPECAARVYRRQRLRAEAARITAERAAEEEDRHKWSERLPQARRRLADLDAEIAKLTDPA
ncbi:MAG: hypothetical protein IT337_01220 [Thermomicrobiales bacterium]|nr:hypothetical protein [Thermomicrobiales bacterium]